MSVPTLRWEAQNLLHIYRISGCCNVVLVCFYFLCQTIHTIPTLRVQNKRLGFTSFNAFGLKKAKGRQTNKQTKNVFTGSTVYAGKPGADPGFCEGGFERGFVDCLKGTFEQK